MELDLKYLYKYSLTISLYFHLSLTQLFRAFFVCFYFNFGCFEAKKIFLFLQNPHDFHLVLAESARFSPCPCRFRTIFTLSLQNPHDFHLVLAESARFSPCLCRIRTIFSLYTELSYVTLCQPEPVEYNPHQNLQSFQRPPLPIRDSLITS